jgi:hypothetical protein
MPVSTSAAIAASVCRWACAESPNSIDDAKIATMHTTPARDRNAAIVLAAVKGETLTL